jgi:type I restriction enzyme M protein
VKSKLNASKEIESKTLEKVNLLDFTQKYVQHKKTIESEYDVVFDFDEASFKDISGNIIIHLINGSKELLSVLYDNLIENAIKHAFLEITENRIEFYLSAYLEDDKNILTLLVSNTGIPADKDFSIEKLATKGFRKGADQGDGFGGWYMNEIIRKHKGNWDCIDETRAEGLAKSDLVTSFEINFPINE